MVGAIGLRRSITRHSARLFLLGGVLMSVFLPSCGLFSNKVSVSGSFDEEKHRTVVVEIVDQTDRRQRLLSPASRVETAASAILLSKGYEQVEFKELERQQKALADTHSRRSQAGGPEAGKGRDIQTILEVTVSEFVPIVKKEQGEIVEAITRVRLSANLKDARTLVTLWSHAEQTFEFDMEGERPNPLALRQATEEVVQQLPPRPFFWWLLP